MLQCRLCKLDKAIEELIHRRGKFSNTCKACHAYEVRVYRSKVKGRPRAKDEGQSELIETNERAFTIGLQGKLVVDFEAGLRFPLALEQDPAKKGSLYVKRWNFRDRIFNEAILEFGEARISFDLSLPSASTRIPRAVWQLGLKIVSLPESYRGEVPMPTELPCILIKQTRSVSVLQRAWECSGQSTEDLAKLFRIGPLHLAVLANRGRWKRMQLKPTDFDMLRTSLGLP